MTWAIKVENLSKRYRMGSAITPATDTLYQMIEQRLTSITQRFKGAPPPSSQPATTLPPKEGTHLVLASEQLEGAPPGHFWALRNVSFEIKEGERIGIVGKNGSGKSTLLKILSRITTPTEGQFRFRGRLVSLLEVGTGFHPDLSGRENIILNAKINGMSSRAIRQKFDEIVDFSELGQQIDTPIKRYSSGMYMRLAFSVAAHLESEILIVDEVLAVGDAGFQKKCLDKMLEISGGGGRTLLFVSHDMNAISSLCTQALELSHGRIVETPVASILQPPKPALNEDGIATIIDNSSESPQEEARSGLRPVNDAILDYVLDKAIAAEQVWSEQDAPSMDRGNVILRRVAVTNVSGEVSETFDVKDDIHVVMDFDVRVKKWKLNAHVYLTTLTGQRLFLSMDNLDVNAVEREPGSYRETCCIKSPYLNEGIFRVTVVVCTNPTTEHHIGIVDVTSFTVKDDNSPTGVRGDWIREWPDYPMRPRMTWSIKREELAEPSPAIEPTYATQER